MRQALIFWHHTLLEARRVTHARLRFAGHDIELPEAGEVTIGPLRVRVEILEDVRFPPRRAFLHRATLASALAHLVALVVIAGLAHVDPAHGEAEATERIRAMQGYLARTDQTPLPASDHQALDDVDRVLGTIANAPDPLPAHLPTPARGRTHKQHRGSGGSSECVALESYWVADAKGMREVPARSHFKWVMELNDGAHPVPNAHYRTFLPDGRTFHEGTTDARGRVCFTGIDPNDDNVLLFFEKYGVSPVCATPQGDFAEACET